MRILVFGKNGQVAHCLRGEALRNAAGSIHLTSLSSAECDLMVPGVGAEAISNAKPDIVVNATGYTSVDGAEAEQDSAKRLNADAPAELSAAAHKLGARFIHLSTDYVFDGNTTDAYVETSKTTPLNVYGETKRAGEIAVLAASPDAIIVRTSWVFSQYNANFVRTMLRAGASQQQLKIVDDQIGGPTPAGGIARAVLAIASKIHRGAAGAGIYHYQGSPAVSWADFAATIFETAGLAVEIQKIPTSDYPTAARRPLRTVLDCARIERDFGISRPDWRSFLPPVIIALRDPPQQP